MTLPCLETVYEMVGLISFTDKRVASCYLDVQQTVSGRNVCHKELGDPVSRSTCCCAVGKAWGPQCELCPAPDTEEYKTLCPAGSGFRPNMITVSRSCINKTSFASKWRNSLSLIPRFFFLVDFLANFLFCAGCLVRLTIHFFTF